MRRTTLLTAALTSAALAACGGSELVVEAAIEQETAEGSTEAVPLGDLEVRILPFDRDAVFDSLSKAYDQPEPPIPDSILRLQEAIAQAQDEWQTAEARWNTLRDSLKTLSDRLQNMSRASGEYRVLFQEFGDLEGQVQQLERRSHDAFQRFSGLQAQFASSAEQIRLERAEWGDEAFKDVDVVFDAKLEELGRDMVVDTTNAAGIITQQLPAGQWWVHTRYELPFTELYWNVPVTVEGDSVHLRLTRENAQMRPKL